MAFERGFTQLLLVGYGGVWTKCWECIYNMHDRLRPKDHMKQQQRHVLQNIHAVCF